MLDIHIQSLFQSAKREMLQDGYESSFERLLKEYVREQATEAVIAVGECADQEGGMIGSFALRSLGELDHVETRVSRRLVLQACLRSESSWIRDGAVLGLAWMDDPASLPALTAAAQRETIPELKSDIVAVIEQIAGTRV